MNDVLQQITVTFARILEEWAMMMVDPAADPKNLFDPSNPVYRAHIRFKGAVCGGYDLYCQRAFAQGLVANLLGDSVAREGGEETHFDALKELANVIAGNLVTETYGKDNIYELSTPVATITTVHEVEALSDRSTLSFLADDEPLVVTFSLDASGEA